LGFGVLESKGLGFEYRIQGSEFRVGGLGIGAKGLGGLGCASARTPRSAILLWLRSRCTTERLST